MQLIVDQKVAESIVGRLSERDRRVGEDARAAVEWLAGFDDEGLPAVFSRRQLQLFLWYQLPRKWLIRQTEQQAVAEALGCFFEFLGQEAMPLAALCRSSQTAELIRTRGRKLSSALERSGLEPPDTGLLAWSHLMTIEESLERDLVAGMLEHAVDTGQLVPGAKGWRQQQAELVDQYLTTPDASEIAPLSRIHAARREAWLDYPGRSIDERTLLEHALAAIEAHPPSPAEARDAVEPLLWLLDQLADGVKLTQTGAFPRALVRAAVDRYPDWWDTPAVGPPNQEGEVYTLGFLHHLLDTLNLARRHRGILHLAPKGQHDRDDPNTLLTRVAATLGTELPSQLDRELAHLALNVHTNEISWTLNGILTPLNGTVTQDRIPKAVNPSSRTLAAAILHTRAHGPRITLA